MDVEKVIRMTPYVKMKKENAEKTVAPNKILKFSYLNQLTDSSAVLRITDMSETGGKKMVDIKTEVKLKAGQNLIRTDLKNMLKPAEGHVYMAQLVNSKNEMWFVMFEIKEYKN